MKNSKEKTVKDTAIKSGRIMLTMSPKTKGIIEKISEEFGITATQYIMNLIIEDIKSRNKK
jgi:hypothetical protein